MSVNSIVILLVAAISSGLCAQENKTIKLDKRIQSKYLNSGYSFRYKTSEVAKHKNNVDLVYESGKMRINNHGGLESRIADLGELTDFDRAKSIEVTESNWSQELLPPVVGNTYALEIKADNHEMTALIQIKKVSDEQLEFAWQPVKPGKWPVDINTRAQNGTSGMMGRQRSSPSYGK